MAACAALSPGGNLDVIVVETVATVMAFSCWT
jgi:hypothetical protein